MSSDLPPPQIVCDADQSAYSLDQARAARLRGDYACARDAAEHVSAAEPNNADAWLELGLSDSAAGDVAHARAAFLRVLEIAPNYDDAKLGLARLAYRSGEADEARTWLSRISPDRAGDAEVEALQASLRTSPAGGAIWRWDGAGSYSSLSGGLAPWREASVSVSRREEAQSIGASIEYSDRFDRTDVYGEARYARAMQHGTWELAIGGTPDADFRPEAAVRIGFWSAEFDGWAFDGALTVAQYNAGEVDSLSTSAQRSFGDWRAHGRVIVVRDEIGDVRYGYGVGAAWRRGDWPAIDVAWTDAPESSEGVTVDVRSTAFGLTFELASDLRLRAGGVWEERESFDRAEASFVLTKSF
jgi:YaiO family outer membrane protein